MHSHFVGIMRRLICFLMQCVYKTVFTNAVCVATEYCRDGHDEDCNSTVCSTGFRPDCHHVVKKHIDAYICTCKVTGMFDKKKNR